MIKQSLALIGLTLSLSANAGLMTYEGSGTFEPTVQFPQKNTFTFMFEFDDTVGAGYLGSSSRSSIFGSATTHDGEYLASYYNGYQSEECPGSVDNFCVRSIEFSRRPNGNWPNLTSWLFTVSFDPRLSSSSGVSVVNAYEVRPYFSSADAIVRSGTGTASVDTASEVPIPATLWLVGPALLGLGVIKRQRA